VNPQPNLTSPAATLVPDDACVPGAFREIPIAYFDHYSWRAFIALAWPAKRHQRGVPDPDRPLEKVRDIVFPSGDVNVPTVFETFKADWETFQNGIAPSDWNNNDALMTSGRGPCPMARPGDFLLASVSKYGDTGNIGEAGVASYVSVLVSQNGKFVRYLVSYNEKQFKQIRDDHLYIMGNVENAKIRFKTGSLSVKSSWIDMTNILHPERFHRREAWLVDPFSHVCNKVTVGLVGLHIVQKTPSRQQWIWSTFEHVDNVPPPGYVPPLPPEKPEMTFTFNDGTNTPMPRLIPQLYRFDNATTLPEPPAPINIQRLRPINSSVELSRNTMETNFMWQRALRAENSVWQYYQLTMTQWPTIPTAPGSDVPGTPGYTTPGEGPSDIHSAFANTTLETWPQTDVNKGCMNCHSLVQNNDFVWSMQMNASSTDHSRSASPALGALQKLLNER
jgi:hypothetical protein